VTYEICIRKMQIATLVRRFTLIFLRYLFARDLPITFCVHHISMSHSLPSVAPPGFCNRGEVAPQTTVHHLCNVYRCCRCYRYQYYRLDIRLHDARADGVVAVTGTDLVVVFEAEVVTHLMRQSRRRAAGHRVVVLCRNRTTYVRHDTTCYFSVRSKADLSQLTR